MTLLTRIRNSFSGTQTTSSPVAYDLWSASYDDQPNNLMLYLDEQLFDSFLKTVDITNKRIVDVGCGTGRHWNKIFDRDPLELTGYDVSEGMLTQLKRKFADAKVYVARDNFLSDIKSGSIDVIISTLTIAHLKNINEVFASWFRVLKPTGEIFISDYHPALLANGGKRNFQHNNKSVTIKNYVHSVDELKKTAAENGLVVISLEERFIDENVKDFYHRQNALTVYEKHKGSPVIFALHMRKL